MQVTQLKLAQEWLEPVDLEWAKSRFGTKGFSPSKSDCVGTDGAMGNIEAGIADSV